MLVSGPCHHNIIKWCGVDSTCRSIRYGPDEEGINGIFLGKVRHKAK
jgi:hypothetical protein